MLIIENGKIEHIEDLPNDYNSSEWQAYDKAFDGAMEAHKSTGAFVFTDEMKSLYSDYQDAMQRAADNDKQKVRE